MTINIPDETLAQAHLSPADLLVELAVYLYDKGTLSMGRARKLAGLSQLDFQHELAKRNVYIKFGVEDLEKDLKNLGLAT